MAQSAKHAKSVQNMTTSQLKAVILSGSLLAAAAKAELQRREGK
jgi:hypothetical protein